ncbi:UDP-N-acetylmuramate--L-alanine ligase [Candidatus Parcubacteria bacterium]|nr:UDP-N-acetylmuramate--L-alanine ligase [Candidatus Parcubacteria bacterium]
MKKQKIFFIGIGGKGLNGIAKICLQKGYDVYGVDKVKKRETISLEKDGAKIFYRHSSKNIGKEIDLVVYSSLVKNCPEIKTAKKLGIKIMKRAEFLGELTKDDYRICVSGSHGKSTTTAILGLSLINSGIDATIYGGAYAKEFDGYNHLGKTNYSVLESCEFDRSFFNLVGRATILTSVEKGHLEYYKDENEMKEAFSDYFHMHNSDSLIVANGDDLNVRLVTFQSQARKKYFGFNQQNDFVIKVHQQDENGSVFSIYEGSNLILGNIKIYIPGEYNIKNFVAVAVMMYELGFPLGGILETAKTFSGVGRRFETHKARTGQILIDDFAHHPSQVKSLFDGVRQFYPDKKVYAVFEPRQYNLIKNFLREYGKAFEKVDEVIITDILPALNDGQQDISSVNAKDVENSIKVYSKKPVIKINGYNNIYKYLKHRTDQDSVITTIGTGDIYKVRDKFLV